MVWMFLEIICISISKPYMVHFIAFDKFEISNPDMNMEVGI